MNVKTETKKIITRTFSFDANECQAFDIVARICDSIRLGFDFENASEMISNCTGEVLTYEDLDKAVSVLDTLMLNDKQSWDLNLMLNDKQSWDLK